MNTYLRYTLSDRSRNKELNHLEAVIRPNQPTSEFDLEKWFSKWAIWTFRGALASKQSDGGVEIVKGALEQLQ